MRKTLLTLAVMLFLGLGAAPARTQEEAEPEPPNKGKEILDRTIEALGGETYLNVRDITRRGRLYTFSRGALSSPGQRLEYVVKFPGRERQDYGKKGNIVYAFSQDQGWELDRQGIREMSEEQIEDFHQGNKHDIDYLLRFRVQEESMNVYYLGREFADNRRAHLLELVDAENDSVTLVVDTRTYLPMQLRYRERDALSGERLDVVEYYGKYITVQGISTPMQFTRERAGLRALEAHWQEVQYNTGVSDAHFTRAALEERWRKVK